MIFCVEIPQPVGKVVNPDAIIIEGVAVIPQPLYIVREATWEEYLAENVDNEVPRYFKAVYFYEVSTD